MKYLIVSDIHGSLPRLQQVMRHFEEMKMDMLVVLGDILNYGPRNSLPEGLDAQGVADCLNKHSDHIIAVRGNCDSEVDQMLLDFPIMADYALIADNGKRLFLTHGHIYNEEQMPKLGFDIFCYGHTHLQKLEQKDGKIILNTGSITFPKAGNEPTFATFDGSKVRIHRLYGSVKAEM